MTVVATASSWLTVTEAAVPTALQETVGIANPIAYALDGFAIYGALEPDGSATAELDEYNGHLGTDGLYHYHGTVTYPYVNGGLRGVVTVSDQVEPQPTTTGFRPAGAPLPGATIIAFESPAAGSYHLEYELDGATGSVDYTVEASSIMFT